MTIRCAIALFAGAMAGSPSRAADWPQWRGSNRDDVSAETGLLKSWPPSGPKLLWTFTDAGAGYGGPAIVGNRLYILGCEDAAEGGNEFLVAVNVKDGKQIWRTPLNTSAGRYTYGWGAGPRSTPTVDGDKVYVLGAKGDLLCLDASSGGIVWSKNLVKDLGGGIPGWGYAESVLIDGAQLVCTPGGTKGSLAALNKATGELVWRSRGLADWAGFASIVVAEVSGVRQYVQQTNQSVVGVRASDGQLLWKASPIQYRTAVIPTPVVHDDHVFVTSGYDAGCALLKLAPDGKEGTSAKVVYANKAMVNHHGGVVRVGEYIYGYSEQAGWVCLDYKNLTGEKETPIWSSKKLGKGSAMCADGHLYCYAETTGTVALVEASPKGWNEKGRFELPQKSQLERRSGKIWTHPVVANGRLYLRDLELVFCFDVGGPP